MGHDHSDIWGLKVPPTAAEGASWTWQLLGSSSSSGAWPLERHGHGLMWAGGSSPPNATTTGAAASSNSQVYLYGGQRGTLEVSPYLGDTWVLDLSTGNATELQQGTTDPTASQPVSRALFGRGLFWGLYKSKKS